MKWNKLLSIGGFLAFFLGIHLYGITQLPIFADEAIYIRWSQLILSDWRQYLFFSLNDGKTPLLFWLQLPFIYFISNPLLAARLLSVLVGLAQVVVLVRFTKAIGGSRIASWVVAILTAILPYWYFHHRMALIDGLLTLFLSVTVWKVWELCAVTEKYSRKLSLQTFLLTFFSEEKMLVTIGLAGVSLGAALWTKLPAVLILPPLVVLASVKSKSAAHLLSNWLALGIVTVIGGSAFLTLSFHPAFPQLFSRGGDFVFSVSELFTGPVLSQTVPNVPTYLGYFTSYATISFWILLITGLFYGKNKRTTHELFWLGVLFLLPMFILGRVVYPRYLVPAMIFFTPAVSLVIDGIVQFVQKRKLTASTSIVAVTLCVLCANIVQSSMQFIVPAILQPEEIPFVSADAEQYLLEWSSGHGITETVALIVEAAKTRRIAVATEGYFGTLPDALLVYFFNLDVESISIDGIGQPIHEIPKSFLEKTKQADERWLVVNSHRLRIADPGARIAEFCRPRSAPCLQVWRLDE